MQQVGQKFLVDAVGNLLQFIDGTVDLRAMELGIVFQRILARCLDQHATPGWSLMFVSTLVYPRPIVWWDHHRKFYRFQEGIVEFSLLDPLQCFRCRLNVSRKLRLPSFLPG